MCQVDLSSNQQKQRATANPYQPPYGMCCLSACIGNLPSFQLTRKSKSRFFFRSGTCSQNQRGYALLTLKAAFAMCLSTPMSVKMGVQKRWHKVHWTLYRRGKFVNILRVNYPKLKNRLVWGRDPSVSGQNKTWESSWPPGFEFHAHRAKKNKNEGKQPKEKSDKKSKSTKVGEGGWVDPPTPLRCRGLRKAKSGKSECGMAKTLCKIHLGPGHLFGEYLNPFWNPQIRYINENGGDDRRPPPPSLLINRIEDFKMGQIFPKLMARPQMILQRVFDIPYSDFPHFAFLKRWRGQLWRNMIQNCQNMMKICENQWFLIQKYDFIVKMVFLMIFYEQMQNLDRTLKILKICFNFLYKNLSFLRNLILGVKSPRIAKLDQKKNKDLQFHKIS